MFHLCTAGMGFVRYVRQESAARCVEEGAGGGMTLDGRTLIVAPAVSREKAAGFQQLNVKEKKDSRNLYLAREGCEWNLTHW